MNLKSIDIKLLAEKLELEDLLAKSVNEGNHGEVIVLLKKIAVIDISIQNWTNYTSEINKPKGEPLND